MSSHGELVTALEEWKNIKFRPDDITLTRAAKSLSTDDLVVRAQPSPNNRNRWVLYSVATNKIAVLTHAVVWRWGMNFETGNLVPEGEIAPPGLHDSRIQRLANSQCEFIYTFDTAVDDSLYEHLTTIEAHALGQPGFNAGQCPRKTWQDGNRPESRSRYQAATKMFTRRTPHNIRRAQLNQTPCLTHDWVSETLSEQSEQRFMSNPDIPIILDYVNGTSTEFDMSEGSCFKRGNIVWISFKVGFVFMGEFWVSKISLVELMRVEWALEDVPEAGVDYSSYLSLDEGFTLLGSGSALTPIDEQSVPLKRKARDITSDDVSDLTDDGSSSNGSRKRLDLDEDTVMVEDDSIDTAGGALERLNMTGSKRRSTKARGRG